MARRTHRYRGVKRPKTGTTLATLAVMVAVLIGILAAGDDLAGGLSGFFAPATQTEGIEQLPSQLPADDGEAAGVDGQSVGQGEVAVHTGAIVRRAIREAVIVARRPIARMGTAVPLDAADAPAQSPADFDAKAP